MKKIFLAILMVTATTAVCFSAEPLERVIALKDGSTVQGKLTGLENGVYMVSNPSLGVLRVKEADVVSISAPRAMPPKALPGQEIPAESIEQVQSKIMSDPDIMAMVQEMANDPEIVKIMSDPAFVQAAQSRDMIAVQTNPRMAQLMANPKIKALIERMQAANQR